MEFFETVEKRKSIRVFLQKEIEKEKVGKILEAISLAPSAGNLQAYRIAMVKSRKAKDELSASNGQKCIAQAATAFVFLADGKASSSKYEQRGKELYCVQDATIAAAYCQLAAAALGLGSVWVGGFDPAAVGKIIGAKENETPVAIIPVGYAAESPERRLRKKMESMAHEL